MAKLKIFTIHDGRINYAVASPNRRDAVDCFNKAGIGTSVSDQSEYGEMFDIDEHDDMSEIAANPGALFKAPFTMRETDVWQRLEISGSNIVRTCEPCEG